MSDQELTPRPQFLSRDELKVLTGRVLKSKQIEALLKMRIPFWTNARGEAVVSRSSVELAPNVELERPKTKALWSPGLGG